VTNIDTEIEKNSYLKIDRQIDRDMAGVVSCDVHVNVNEADGDDLTFINELNKEPKESKLGKCDSSADMLVLYRNRRRNSSFAEYFEGDLSQLLLSRKHFKRRATMETNEALDIIANTIKETECADNGVVVNFKKDQISKKKKISEILLPSNWFFRKSEETVQVNDALKYKRAKSEPKELEDTEENVRKISLSQIIAKHFSAAKDIRSFNITMPQSQ